MSETLSIDLQQIVLPDLSVLKSFGLGKSQD